MGAGNNDLHALRDELIRQVEDGEITPKKADARAAKAGLPPFETTPSADRFDPMTLSTWTVPMALAWIIWRSPEMVRESWDDYLQECRQWIFISGRYRLQPRNKASIAALGYDEDIEGAIKDNAGSARRLKTVKEAKAELWRMLELGAVGATAVDIVTGNRIDISAAAWIGSRIIEFSTREELQLRHPVARCDRVSLSAPNVRDIWLPRLDLKGIEPPLFPPEADAYTPLFCVAHWIATQGGMCVGALAPEVWQDAYNQLLGEIVAGEHEVIGTRAGTPERIEPHVFAGCRVILPFAEIDDRLLQDNELVLVSHPFIDDERWRSGFDDSLRNRSGALWSRLSLRRSALPEPPEPTSGSAGRGSAKTPARYRTGAVGQPTSKHIVLRKLNERIARDEFCDKLIDEARVIAEWLRIAHPDAPQPTVGAIENIIREAYNKAKTARRKIP